MDQCLSNEPERGHLVTFRVRYYETDAMGIVHHSNYLRWFEMARTEYLRAAGLPYRVMEESGTGCPVIGARCQYHHSARYDDEVQIRCWISAYSGVRLSLAYTVMRDDTLLCTGETDHTFVHGGRVVAPRRSLPDVDTVLSRCLVQDQAMN
jgi:acyl-CoA thioester hydrolase